MGASASKEAAVEAPEGKKGKKSCKEVELDPPPRVFTEAEGAAALEKVDKDGFWGVVLQKWS